MILSLASSLRTVFSIYAVFWVVAILGLYFAVGALMTRAERASHKQGHGGSEPRH